MPFLALHVILQSGFSQQPDFPKGLCLSRDQRPSVAATQQLQECQDSEACGGGDGMGGGVG